MEENDFDWVSQALHALAVKEPPRAGAYAGIQHRIALRSHHRMTGRRATHAVLAIVVAVSLGFVVQNSLTRASHKKPPERVASGASDAGSGEFIGVTAKQINIISATGSFVRSVPLTPPLDTIAGGQIAATSSGGLVFVSILRPGGRCSSTIVAINLLSGRVTTIATGQSPALDRSGQYLAYLAAPAAAGHSGDNCGPTTVVVRNLTSTFERKWVLVDSPSNAYGDDVLTSVSWEPDGRHLLVTRLNSSPPSVQVLDTLAPASSNNPRDLTVLGGLPLRDPIEDMNGQFVYALTSNCSGTTSCIARQTFQAVRVSLSDGSVTAITSTQQLDMYGIILASSPARIVIEAGSVVAPDLYVPSGAGVAMFYRQAGMATWVSGQS